MKRGSRYYDIKAGDADQARKLVEASIAMAAPGAATLIDVIHQRSCPAGVDFKNCSCKPTVRLWSKAVTNES